MVRRITVVASVAVAVLAAGLPAAAASPATVTGVVQDVVVDDPRHRHGADETERILRVGDEVVPLTEDSLPAADSGDTVRVRLRPTGGGERQVTSATTVAEAPAPDEAAVAGAASATHHVYAVIVTPKGIPADARLTGTLVDTVVGRASSYWSSQTGGAVSFDLANAGAVPTYTSAYPCTSATAERDMWTEALAKVAVPATAVNHLMIFVPYRAYQSGCAYGLGSIGAWPGQPGLTFVAHTNQSLVAHELGHNLGLRHSGAVRCAGAQDATYSAGRFAGCALEPYGDLFDVMGYSGAGYGEGNLNAVQLHQMGLLPVHDVTVGAAQTVRIQPLSSAPTGTRVLRVVDPSGPAYFVEYRTNSGRDRAAAGLWQGPTFGVRVLRGLPSDGGSVVLDATPTGNAAEYAHTLAVGRTFTAASRRLTVTVKSADSTGATVVVDTSALSVPARATLSGLPRRAKVRAAVTARVTVTNAAGRPVPGWSVRLQKLAKSSRSYATVRTVRTDVNGVASFRFANGISGHYRYVTASASGAPARVSNVVSVGSQAAVSLRKPKSSTRRGRKLSVSGSVSAVPSPRVYVQVRRAGGRWGKLVRVSVRGTKVQGKVRLARKGTYHVRFYLRAGAGGRYLADYSPAYRLRVR